MLRQYPDVAELLVATERPHKRHTRLSTGAGSSKSHRSRDRAIAGKKFYCPACNYPMPSPATFKGRQTADYYIKRVKAFADAAIKAATTAVLSSSPCSRFSSWPYSRFRRGHTLASVVAMLTFRFYYYTLTFSLSTQKVVIRQQDKHTNTNSALR